MKDVGVASVLLISVVEKKAGAVPNDLKFWKKKTKALGSYIRDFNSCSR